MKPDRLRRARVRHSRESYVTATVASVCLLLGACAAGGKVTANKRGPDNPSTSDQQMGAQQAPPSTHVPAQPTLIPGTGTFTRAANAPAPNGVQSPSVPGIPPAPNQSPDVK